MARRKRLCQHCAAEEHGQQPDRNQIGMVLVAHGSACKVVLAEAADEQDAEAVHGLTDELHPRIVEGIFLHFAYTKIAANTDERCLHHHCDENGAHVDEIP